MATRSLPRVPREDILFQGPRGWFCSQKNIALCALSFWRGPFAVWQKPIGFFAKGSLEGCISCLNSSSRLQWRQEVKAFLQGRYPPIPPIVEANDGIVVLENCFPRHFHGKEGIHVLCFAGKPEGHPLGGRELQIILVAHVYNRKGIFLLIHSLLHCRLT